MRRTGLEPAILLTLAVLWFAAPGKALFGQQPIDIAIVCPSIDEPLFGSIEVEVRIASTTAVARVELWLDGARMSARSETPWAQVDVGQENREHRFEIVARRSPAPTLG